MPWKKKQVEKEASGYSFNLFGRHSNISDHWQTTLKHLKWEQREETLNCSSQKSTGHTGCGILGAVVQTIPISGMYVPATNSISVRKGYVTFGDFNFHHRDLSNYGETAQGGVSLPLVMVEVKVIRWDYYVPQFELLGSMSCCIPIPLENHPLGHLAGHFVSRRRDERGFWFHPAGVLLTFFSSFASSYDHRYSFYPPLIL